MLKKVLNFNLPGQRRVEEENPHRRLQLIGTKVRRSRREEEEEEEEEEEDEDEDEEEED